ncbi:BMP family ABC transporter substrate-binding protein [Comamonas sp. GB3 AK4-5]|uniref:BMP family ABC transporter substrate-binding protein n=1 Tax=Comamonas sp. GB3 AK4-5 TaxID=3231487 RepID=UPI00351DF5E5
MGISNLSPRTARHAVVLFGPQGQGSFNESGLLGARRAQAAGYAVDVHWVAGQSAAQRAEEMQALCSAGYALIVAHGGQGDGPVALLAPQFPRQAFAVTQGSLQAPNVARYEVLQEQSAFLAGVLAARLSRSQVVGHFSGEKVPPGLRGRAAYAHGLRAAGFAGPLITQFCGHQHQPDWARQCVQDMAVQTGLDVLFAMIDGGRPGVSAACREHGIAQIGNVLPWVERDPQVFIASAICDSGEAVLRAIADHGRGQLPLGGYRAFGLEEPALVRLDMADRVGSEDRAAIDDWAQRLLRGDVVLELVYDGPEHPLPALVPAGRGAAPGSPAAAKPLP